MLTSQRLTPSVPAPAPSAAHEFAYPRVSQIAPRAHTVLVSSLRARPAHSPAVRAL
jgi:hypothetical protein